MVKYITCGVLLLFCLIACNKDNTVLNGNKFNFDLGNSYTVENSGVFTSTPRAYKAEYLYYPNELSDDIMVPFEIWLTDAEIGSVLYSCCSNHSYISPPTRRIIFNFYNGLPSKSCVLHYNQYNDNENDFSINIQTYTGAEQTEGSYSLLGRTVLASTGSGTYDYSITEAKVKITETKNDYKIKYIIHTLDGGIIYGSYEGNLDIFTHDICNADCD